MRSLWISRPGSRVASTSDGCTGLPTPAPSRPSISSHSSAETLSKEARYCVGYDPDPSVWGGALLSPPSSKDELRVTGDRASRSETCLGPFGGGHRNYGFFVGGSPQPPMAPRSP